MERRSAIILTALIAAHAGPALGQAVQVWQEPPDFVADTLAAVCSLDDPGAKATAERLGGATLLEERFFEAEGAVQGARRRFRLPNGDEVVLLRSAPQGLLRRFTLEYHQYQGDRPPRPVAMAVSGSDCRIFHGRVIHYDTVGAIEIVLLGPGMTPTGEALLLNPPVPAGRDPGGVAVALFDSGLNYLNPAFARRLARDPAGRLLGYDFWDLDERPFDSHPAASPFFPARHGTAVASVLIREAPVARLLPYRYPRPALVRMADMVEAAADAGALIAAMPMGSSERADWDAFATAARRHPEMLFIVSAGNNGRDIDREPVYPAALPLDNLLVVTSSDDLGGLAPGSNWGAQTVDLMVPAEHVSAVGFDGAPEQRSGSSFAVPRVAALAARLLARHPDWRGPELKAAILDLAISPSDGATTLTAHGWLPDPHLAR